MGNKRYSCIGLYNPKSPENVGAVMRAAGCYGVASVFYTGKRYERARDFVTDTKRCLLYTSPSPRDLSTSRMPSSA